MWSTEPVIIKKHKANEGHLYIWITETMYGGGMKGVFANTNTKTPK